MNLNDTFELELTAMANGGSALGRHGNRTVFVPYTIPGERILARVMQDKGRIAFAEGVQLLDASADRVYPRCPHFGPHRCGRCQWQHIDYPAQLLLKQDVLADQLARVGGFDDDALEAAVQPVIPSAEQWNYNYQMTFEVSESGALGFPSADGRGVFPIEGCPILHPTLLELYDSLDLEQVSELRRLRLQLGSDGAHMLILWTDDDEAPELETDLSTSVNLVMSDHLPVNLIGEFQSHYALGGHSFRVTAGSVFRAHVAQIEPLATLVRDALDLGRGETVLDLYGGVGVFSAFTARQARRVVLVDSYPPAIEDAKINLAGFANVEIVEATVESALSTDEAYDRAVLDPPPEGLSVEVIDALERLRIPRLVYVSSDPAVLARDGKRLARHGYHLVRAQPIDLAPQTYYIDTVATFVRTA
jgi:23S rRNA (uracil1939-C5)-methyltransferase